MLRFNNWNRLSWWQRTAATALIASICALFLALVVAVLVSAFATTGSLSTLGWFNFSLLPLIVVMIIATIARVQQRINVTSGYVDSDPARASRKSSQ